MKVELKDIYQGNLILVNPGFPVRENVPDQMLASPFDTQPWHRITGEASENLKGLLHHIGAGREIVGVSGYRTLEEQITIWNESEKENGPTYTRKYVALPGHSEHQTGLAMDVALNQEQIDFICPYFPYEGICQTFRMKAAEFGFVERYPAGRELVTGIGAEPWHFRYVGVPHASLMTEHGMVLEEYIEWLKAYPFTERPLRYSLKECQYLIGYVPWPGGVESFTLELSGLPEGANIKLSGNNVDGLVVSVSL